MSPAQVPLGPFALHGVMGRGAMAEVWHGVHRRQSLPVAVKVITGRGARDPERAERIRAEAQAVARLHHPGIVVVLDHGAVDAAAEAASGGLIPAGSPYIAMELAERGTLRDVPGRLSFKQVKAALLALLDALAHAHARGVIHRDLKPSNVLCFGADNGPRLKLADFGLSYALDAEGKSDEAICGTPWYMAPEQVTGNWRDYGPWTDLYALGCMAYELVSDAPIFADRDASGASRGQIEEDPPPLSPGANVPPGFEDWMRTLLRKHPRERFQLAADAAEALRTIPDDGKYRIPARRLADRPTTTKLADLPTAPLIERTTSGRLPRSQAPHLPMAGATPAEREPRAVPTPPRTWKRDTPAPAAMPLVDAGLGLYGLRAIPLVGREKERDALWQAMLEVHKTRRPMAVFLHGAAGHGKGRLAEWLAERAHEVGAARSLRATHGAVAGPGDGLGRMAARHLGCLGLDREQARERICALLTAEGVTEETECQALAEMLEPTPTAQQSAVERHDLVLRLLARASKDRPLVLWLDDVQWAADALGLVHRLLRSELGPPVLVLATVLDEALQDRPVEEALVESLESHPRSQRIEVGPLPPEERKELVRSLLGLQGDLAQEVERRCAGNPLFAVQLVGDWVERGVLVAGESGFVLKEGERALLPDTLHDVWKGRVERALEGAAEAQDALEIAAALGLQVEEPEWRAACEKENVRPPPGLLERLVKSRLALRTDTGWSFVHGMLRESLERIAREEGRWTAHNKACAEMLQEETATRGRAERLGRHWLQAGEAEEAAGQLLQGARERRETSDYAVAHGLLKERETALETIKAGDSDPRWAEGRVLKARIALHEGKIENVLAAAREAERAARTHGWTEIRSESLRLLGDAARRQGDLQGAESLYDACIALGKSKESSHAIAASLWGLGDVLRQRGDTKKALALFARSRDLYEGIADSHGLADHLIGCADVAWQDRDLPLARRLYGEALDLFQQLGNRYGMSRGWNGLGEVARVEGDLHSASGFYRTAASTLERISSAEAVFPRLNLALVDLAAGKDADARSRLLESRHELVKMHWHSLLAFTDIALLACPDADWSTWDASLASASTTLASASAVESDVAWCAELAGRKLIESGQPERAHKILAMAVNQWRSLGQEQRASELEDHIRSASS